MVNNTQRPRSWVAEVDGEVSVWSAESGIVGISVAAVSDTWSAEKYTVNGSRDFENKK
jgi:hypothetical protein